MRVIAAITNANPTEVTTTFAHQYITGTIVILDLPVSSGMQQINQKFGPITVTGLTTFTIPIDSTQYDLFMIPASFPPTYQDAQVIPFGENNDMLRAATKNVLPYWAT
jgi:hypothetical protein